MAAANDFDISGQKIDKLLPCFRNINAALRLAKRATQPIPD
jgi:hypothetical protein